MPEVCTAATATDRDAPHYWQGRILRGARRIDWRCVMQLSRNCRKLLKERRRNQL